MTTDKANDAAKSKEEIKDEGVAEIVEEKPAEKPPEEEKTELAVEDKGVATKDQIAEVKLGKFYSVKQVATSLGFSTAYISYLLAGDSVKDIPPRIHGVKVLGGSWRIPQSEYDRLIKEGPLPLKKPDEDKKVTTIKVEADEVVDKPDTKVKVTKSKLEKVEEKPSKFPHFRLIY